MDTRFILLGLKTYGMKCLEKPIELQFYNKTIDSGVFNKPFIKSIYGTNGEGKSAIAHTLNLYKNSCISANYLYGESYIGSFKEIVNKNKQKILVDLYFASIDKENGPTIFHHIVEYILKDKDLYIDHEVLYMCGKESWGYSDKETKVYETKGGEIIFLHRYINKYKDEIIRDSRNMLNRNSASLPFVYFSFKRTGEEDDGVLSFYYACLQVLLFAYSINVFLDNSDIHQVTLAKAMSYSDKLKDNIDEAISTSRFVFDKEVDEVDANKIDQYRKEINKVASFIKIFKPELETIDIEESVNRGTIMCKKVLVYKNGSSVSIEYESSGVKKLFRLYPYLNSIDSGGISFIDEFDSNIHDVYLCKLVEYFLNYTSGQLIFTTHNLGPMELLSEYKLKHAIDFINDGEITSWTRNGNYSVVNLYRGGAIKNCPFNIDAADFVKVFGE
ncbi:MAG: ATP-binding protein [Erysipelotrichaceae bacterium]|nr:ATP-binding protein [Erysipelotrichaceae bacterium]